MDVFIYAFVLQMELEADHRGITELLEKKSLDLDLPATNSLKENRHPKKVCGAKKFNSNIVVEQRLKQNSRFLTLFNLH